MCNKNTIFFIVCFTVTFAVSAQEFDVRSFEAESSDMAALRYPRTTVNDEPAALVKVITNISGMSFDSNQGIVDVERKEAEYWVYVAPRERRIRLMAPEFLAKDVSLPEPARSLTVYHLVVTRKGMLAPITDLVRLDFRLNESNVFIRQGDQAPVLTLGNNAVMIVEMGEHSFRFIKEGFEEKTLTLDVLDDDEVFVELKPGHVTSLFEPPGFIVTTSEPAGAEVYLNDQRVGVTPYQNTHISGNYSLLLRHPDYHDHHQTFLLEAGATITIPTVSLLPRYGFFEITSNPSGADVLLNNRLIGNTPLEKRKIGSDHHELTLRYAMYHDHNETFTIDDGEHKRFDLKLKPAFGALHITSEPLGSTVFLDGREAGTTPYEYTHIPSGSYNVRLTHDLYADAVENIVINDGQTTERFIPLAQNFGSLEIQAEDADIYIDDVLVGRDSHALDLTPGPYLVKAVRPLHHDDVREVFIRLGHEKQVSLAPAPKTGYVSISSEPFDAVGAEIWIDGVRQQSLTPAVITLLEGSYELRLKKEGYKYAVSRIDIKENATTETIIFMENSTCLGTEIILPDCFSDNEYLRGYGYEKEVDPHKLILLINALTELVSQYRISYHTSLFSNGEYLSRSTLGFRIGDNLLMAEVIDIYDQWDLDNIVKSQLQYAVRLNTENFEIDLVYYDTGRQVNSEGELIFIQEQQITVDETVIHELTQNNSERTISSDQEKMDVIYELLYNYLQELGFSIAKESVYGSLFLCLEISLNDAKKCLFDMRNQN